MSELETKMHSWNYMKFQVKEIKQKIVSDFKSMNGRELEAALDALENVVKLEQQFMRCYIYELKRK